MTPPTMVITGRALSICAGSTVMRSAENTVTSASLPASSVLAKHRMRRRRGEHAQRGGTRDRLLEVPVGSGATLEVVTVDRRVELDERVALLHRRIAAGHDHRAGG
jgi:hypothetical protein